MTENKNIEEKVAGSFIRSVFNNFKGFYKNLQNTGQTKETYEIVRAGTGTYLAYGSNGSVRDASRVY